MNVLVINSGSSSIKFQLINMKDESILTKGMIDGIGLPTCKVKINGTVTPCAVKNHEEGIKKILPEISKFKIDAVGHRVVHGGEKYKASVVITSDVEKTIEDLSILAPLHNPPNLEGIKACEKLMPDTPQVAVFDTAFHSTIPEEAFLYGLPYEYYKNYGIRKYGFHGTSHRYIMLESKKLLGKKNVNIISCHLGNGSSVTAIKNNKSIDCSLGFTPTGGIIMGTRSGSIDPSISSFIEKKEHLSPEQVDILLNKKSGFIGITGSSDMRTIHENAQKGDKKCKLLINMLAYDISFFVGAYKEIVGNIDAITFTGGIGENAYYVRELALKPLLDVKLDPKKNKKNERLISAKGSKVKVFVIPTNEELMIARDTFALVKKK
jgi:acetate kinase